MSCDLLLRALRDKRLTRTDLAILGALIRIDGTTPSRKQVADEAGCASSSVPRTARKLEEFGYVERVIDAREHGGRAKPTGYRLKADTYQDGHVANLPRTQTETLEVVPPNPKQSPKLAARVEPDTSEIPPYEKTNSTPQELNPERLELASSTARESAAVHVLNGSARGMPAHVLGAILIEHANSPLLANRSYRFHTTCDQIPKWMDAGLDFDNDILPIVKAVCASADEQISTWNYFNKPMRAAVKAKRAAAQPFLIDEATNDHASSATASPIRREKISAATAQRERDRARLEAEARDRTINLGRLESVRVE